MTGLSQRDPKWQNVLINNTQYTIGTDGCLITCLAMQAGTTPDVVVQKIGFNGAQVSWEGLDKIGLEVVERSNVYDNDKVSKYIADNGSCIVRVDWDGSSKTGGDTHFVLFIGNKRMIDPWTGNEVDTSKYPLLTGFRAVRRIGNMPDNQVCIEGKKFEELISKATLADMFVNAGFPNPGMVKELMKSYEETISAVRKERDVASSTAEERRKEWNDLIAFLAKELGTRQDIQEIKDIVEHYDEMIAQKEKTDDEYSRKKQEWAEAELGFTQEIERLKALLDQKNVLENTSFEELLKEIIKRLAKIARLI